MCDRRALIIATLVGIILVATVSSANHYIGTAMENQNHKRKRKIRKKASRSSKVAIAQEQQRQCQPAEKGCNDCGADEKAEDESIKTATAIAGNSNNTDPCQDDCNQNSIQLSVGQVLANHIIDEVVNEAMQRVELNRRHGGPCV